MKRPYLPLVVGLLALAAACGKVRDGEDDTSQTGGNGGSSSDGDGDGGKEGNGGPDGGNPSGGASSSGGASGSGGAVNGGGTESTGGAENTGGLPSDVAEEEGTKAMRAGPTVWVGQVETTVTYPEVVDDPPELSPQKVVMILDRVASGVTGTITFGSGHPPPAPTDPDLPYPPGAEAEFAFINSSNLAFCPYDAFEYSIVSSELRGNTLVLAFVPFEIFRDWCTLQTRSQEICLCDGDRCRGPDGPTRRIELAVTGTTLSGQLSRPPGNYLGEVSAMKLERVK